MIRRVFRFIALLLVITPLLAACASQTSAQTSEFKGIFETVQTVAAAQQSVHAASDALAETQKRVEVQAAKRDGTSVALPDSWKALTERVAEKLKDLKPGTTLETSAQQGEQRSFWERVYERTRERVNSGRSRYDRLLSAQ